MLLSKRKIKFIGLYKKFEKMSDLKIEQLSYERLFDEALEIYFFGHINKIKTPFALQFYKYSKDYLGMDFVTSHFDVAEKNTSKVNEKNVLTFYKIAKDIYMLVKPLYALIGQEDFVPSPDWVVRGTAKLPHFWAFYSKHIVDLLDLDILRSVLEGSYIIEKLPDGGVFFALTKWTDLKQNKQFGVIQKELLKLTGKIRKNLTYQNDKN